MRQSAFAFIALFAAAVAASGLAGGEKKSARKKPKSASSVNKPSDVEAIRAAAKAFAAEFNAGDAKALAAHWTEDGDYVNETGQRFQGRAAIQKEYAEFFAAHPGVKIEATVDSIRLISDHTAIEDGRARLAPPPEGPPAESRYTAVHVKQDGKWYMQSVRESRVPLISNHDRLADLEFLLGKFYADDRGRQIEITGRWIENKNFLERKFVVRENGQVESSATEIIGWDPLAEQIASRTFTSSGGHAVGVWTPAENGWSIDVAGVLIDGAQTRAVNVLTALEGGALSWKSTSRTKGQVELPDMAEIVLKRK